MKYLCVLSYNGFAFKGFERQTKGRTVQGVLEETLSSFSGEPIKVKAAGRTDAGAHALAQTFTFKKSKPFRRMDRFIYAMNRLLPDDMAIMSVKEVADDFDARHSSCGKTYLYKLAWGIRNPIYAGLVGDIRRETFDFDAFSEAMTLFEGEHDFSNFTVKEEDVDMFKRNITKVEVKRTGECSAEIVLEANGFMTYMVRMMIGTAVQCGIHKIEKEKIIELFDLTKCPRHPVSWKAPAGGLYLIGVKYE